MHLSSNLEIRWLHLSDFHFRESQSWEQDYVLKSLLKSIRENFKELNRPDLLFITGDVAFSGKQKEYELAQGFVLELLKATGLSSDRLFVIPGNHDVDRKKEPDAFVGARVTLTGPTEVDKFCQTEVDAQHSLKGKKLLEILRMGLRHLTMEGMGTIVSSIPSASRLAPFRLV